MKLILLVMACLGFQTTFAQNSCAAALPITAGTHTISVIDGTNIPTSCSAASLAEWFAYTPTQNYSVTVTSDLAINICKDTHFMVYTGSCAALNCYTSDDDSGIIPCNNGNTSTYLSTKTFDVIAGTTYYIAWDNRYQTTGFDFQLIESAFVPSPCTTAIPITAGTTTVNAVDGTNITTMCSNLSMAAEWYRYTPTQNYHVTITSDLPANICKDTYFNVYTGSCSGTLTCLVSDDNSGNITCNVGNTNSNLARRTFDVSAGMTYFIAWDSRWDATGFDFQLIEAPIIIPVSYNNQPVANANSSYHLCMTDMDGDGKDDLAGVSNNNLRIHYQGAGGSLTYADFGVPGFSMMPSWSMAAGDYNRDGYTDLLLGSSDGLSFWKSNETGTAYTSITPGQDIFCQRTNFVDLNNDGALDAFSCHDIAPNCYYLNDGTGNLSTFYQTGITPGAMSLGSIGGNYASIFADYDNDGDVDMFISKCSGPPCELHRNDGNGVFTDVTVQANLNATPIDSWSSVVADFDNDGDMDVLIGSNGPVATKVFRNDLNPANTVEEPFVNVTEGSGWDTGNVTSRDYLSYDFDNDGNLDVLSNGNRIMFGQGDLTFEATNYSNMGVGAVGDLNGDGFLDILRNATVSYAVPNQNNWVVVTLKGIQSNIQGIGARVELFGAWGKQIRDIRSGEGFGYMGTLNAHFGIGTATEIEKIVIKWPSGTIDTITNPTSNQFLSVIEGSTLAIDHFASNEFTLFPNPTNDILNIQSGKNTEFKNAEIFDVGGRMVLKTEIANESISVKKLQTGTYILLLRDVDGKTYTQKFLKK